MHATIAASGPAAAASRSSSSSIGAPRLASQAAPPPSPPRPMRGPSPRALWSAGRQTPSRRSSAPSPSSTRTRASLLDRFASLVSGGGGNDANREAAKQELLDLIAPLRRGLDADEDDARAVDAAASRLERLNPTRSPLASPLLNGEWELLYTTSASILGRSKPFFLRPLGPIYQTLDAENLRARNRETAPLFSTVSADLRPMSKSKVAVQFDEFGLLGGLIKIKAPPSAKGELDMTYLDEELRVSRGDKGNLFVLRMVSPGVRP